MQKRGEKSYLGTTSPTQWVKWSLPPQGTAVRIGFPPEPVRGNFRVGKIAQSGYVCADKEITRSFVCVSLSLCVCVCVCV